MRRTEWFIQEFTKHPYIHIIEKKYRNTKSRIVYENRDVNQAARESGYLAGSQSVK